MKPTTGTTRYFLLDQTAGWQSLVHEHLTLHPNGDLTLDPLPGAAQPLLGKVSEQPRFGCPSGLALHGQRLLIADAATHRLTQFRLSDNTLSSFATIGGEGSAPRRLQQPRGLAFTPAGDVVVADTANHRVQIFARSSETLLQVWGARDAQGRPLSGTERGAFCWPWHVVVGTCGTVYVADRGNHRVQQFTRDGVWQGELGACFLRTPVRLALGPQQQLAIADRGHKAVFVMVPGRALPQTLSEVGTPCSVAFDETGNLYVGDADGLIRVFAPDAEASNGYRRLGEGDTHLVGEISDLVWSATHGLLAIIHPDLTQQTEAQPPRQLWRIPTDGNFATSGQWITAALDSRIENCQWHRVLVTGEVPPGSSVQIDSFTAHTPPDTAQILGNSLPWRPCVLAGADNPDCLVQSEPGRYLWLRFKLGSTGQDTPRLQCVQAYFPRASYLQYLPAVYQEDDESRLFLERFLALFQTEFDDLDETIDNVWQLFDPAAIKTEYLPWLAHWLALPLVPEWSPEQTRRMLKRALQSHLRRGTPEGIEQAIADYTGVGFARIAEHFKLRRYQILQHKDSGAMLWSRDLYRRLQLDSYSQVGRFQLISEPEPAIEQFAYYAHKFTVYFPASPYSPEVTTERVRRVVEREKPAHTVATLCPVLPRLRVGVQATLDFDSVVGGVSHLVLNHMATLNYDTVLACSEQEQALRQQGSSLRPRTDVNARLL